MTRCKNCGCECTSNYCPECGQSVSEKRLDNKSFFIDMLTGLSRINKGFLYTAWNLLIHPWTVIRDYIQCRRIRYVAPISMLVLVCFMSAFIGTFMPAEEQSAVTGIAGDSSSILYRMLVYAGSFLSKNVLAQNLTIYIPALVAIPIVYGRVGAKKYNIAEYLTAMLYMASAFLLFDIIASPFRLVSETVYSSLSFAYTILICAMSMYFAFPIASGKRRIGYFAVYLLTVLLIYFILFLTIGIIIGMEMTSR